VLTAPGYALADKDEKPDALTRGQTLANEPLVSRPNAGIRSKCPFSTALNREMQREKCPH